MEIRITPKPSGRIRKTMVVSITLPDCPECASEMDMEFGNVEFSDDGILHIFTCEDCGNVEKWSGEKLNEKGVERPNMSEFVEYFDVSKEDIIEFFQTVDDDDGQYSLPDSSEESE